MQYLDTLTSEFENAANPSKAIDQKRYMRDQFEFFGLTSPQRREIVKPFLVKNYLPPKKDLHKIVKTCWKKPQREYFYFAQELTQKYIKQFELSDIELLEHMIVNKSWWDTIDFIASNLVGPYFKMYPDQIEPCVEKWLDSGNIWLQRSALLFQLKYKDQLDTTLLENIIPRLLGTKEFFINKAIGWILRSHSRVDADWVIDYVDRTELSNLSKREALKLL